MSAPAWVDALRQEACAAICGSDTFKWLTTDAAKSLRERARATRVKTAWLEEKAENAEPGGKTRTKATLAPIEAEAARQDRLANWLEKIGKESKPSR